ncbi:hypothetical protein PR202_ga13225 [Eleusine coracana subsp. coracana]|uniref:Uncharacterized protein n=1 Tax=Eleusine coracana subsp. coracana TaxID=191504 RepID=A0AAV5CED8_ELECO|nr:hypothetical protein PR202_ga13225 [Eleusine coracana subsp. coracana]
MAPRTVQLMIVLFTLTSTLVHKPGAATVSQALHGDELRGQDGAATGIATTITRKEVGHDDGAGTPPAAEEKAASSMMTGAAEVPRLKMGRRFLAGEVGGGDSAAKSSCHSNDVHNGCAPPSKH